MTVNHQACPFSWGWMGTESDFSLPHISMVSSAWFLEIIDMFLDVSSPCLEKPALFWEEFLRECVIPTEMVGQPSGCLRTPKKNKAGQAPAEDDPVPGREDRLSSP